MEHQTNAALKRAIGMLEAILGRQSDLHREMLAVASVKQTSIVSGDIEALERAVAEERRLVGKIEEEEKKRQAVMPLIQSGLGLDPAAITLPEVIALLPEPEKSRLQAVREELKDLLEQCQVKIRHNAELLQTSLEHVDAFLRTVTEAMAPEVGYKRDGKRSGGGSSIIDRKA
ncbi:MAG: flagellar protein FlgN [Planctomycetes bacterium]|nr:flagellar protein FlgN [Planctomycetota bacterium]